MLATFPATLIFLDYAVLSSLLLFPPA